MSAMSGLPIRALVYGRSERSTWLLLTGTASSPAPTPVATLTCASAGCAASSAPPAAAQSAMRFKDLPPISLHLHLVTPGAPIDLDLLACVDRHCRRGGLRLDRGPVPRRARRGDSR